MGKLDPIVSEFDTQEDADAYDAWFRAQVEAALASTKPRIPHDEAMARIRKTVEKHNARSDLGA
ncbi:MAG: stability determinant [Sphingomonadales bacterium]